MKNKDEEPKEYFGGYTVCPLITDIGKVMLAEFDWTAKPTPSFPLDPLQERWIWWLMKVYMLKPMTMHGMLSGKAHFETPTTMQELLAKEKIKVKNETIIDFEKHFWDPMSELGI